MATQNRLRYLRDSEVVEMARLGSREACDELVCRFRAAVLLVARQTLGSQDGAEDVAQEAFLLAFRGLAQLQDPAKFAGWLCAITRHRARRVAKREGRCESAEGETLERLLSAQGDHRAAHDPLETALREEERHSVRTLLDELAPETRIALRLFYFEQWTAARIAEFLSLPLTTVKWRLHTGRQQIRRRFAEYTKENEETYDVRSRTKERDSAPVQTAAQNDGNGGTLRADGSLRERDAQSRAALQRDCGASGRD